MVYKSVIYYDSSFTHYDSNYAECRKIYDIKSEYYCPKPKHEFTIYYLVNKRTGKKLKIDI